MAGEYCAQCGERRPEARDLSLRRFLRASLESVTDFDSRGYRSFRELVTRPGSLTANYVAGRRKPYLSPLQVFLIANLLFFFAAGFLPVVTFDTPLDVHMEQSYGGLVREMVRERNMALDDPDYQAFRTRFDFAARQQAKSLLIVLVPFYALAIAVLRVRRRESAGVHLIFAMHYMAFALLLFIAAGVLIAAGRAAGAGFLGSSSPVIPAVVLGSLMVYLFAAFRRAYGSAVPAAAVQAVTVSLLFLPLLTIFRFILFFTVFYTV